MYALVDCNNFYCACEKIFNPGLEGRPMIILSNNDGCAISRSEEAKALGIAMAAPVFMMQDLIEKHKVAVFSSNYTLYGDISDRIMGTLASFASSMELYSIDEAFLDLGDLGENDLAVQGSTLRKTILKNIGIPVCVGIASTKTLAKMANRYIKKIGSPTGVFWAVDHGQTEAMLASTPVSDIWGIGHQHALFLSRSGFKTAADFSRAPEDWVRKNLSVVGLRILYELRGVPSMEWEPAKSVRKNICTSRSFGKRIGDKNRMAEALANYAASCAAKLREDQSCCRRLEVFIQTNPHKTEEKQYRRSVTIDLDRATSHSGEIIKAALQGLDLIFKPGFLYMKCGVTVMELVEESAVQGSFFDRADRQKDERLMKTMDKINRSLGKDIVRSAVQGFERKYRLKAAFLSPRYTTQMSEILVIRN
jgi:DNA polymerase V